ncbi:MAG: ornithine carbamoyltransferase [Chloroflexi bacterium]|nr:ornithine carbamoyltransferase [Chloroflexota bacterium]MCY3938301.1 ornithine carbamoyltransferase [Chloroflexota bacterium]
MLAGRDFLNISDLDGVELESILDGASQLKLALKNGRPQHLLSGNTLAMIFEKPSLRTRATFEAGMTQLGGHAIDLAQEHLQIGVRETIEDVGRNLCRWVDAIMARVFDHSMLDRLAESSSVPVINGLSDRSHPCQIIADLMTLQERNGSLAGVKLAYVGDGNNVANSLLAAAPRLGFTMVCACPAGYEPDGDLLTEADNSGAGVLVDDPVDAVTDADAVYTDTWVSMGQESEAKERLALFRPFQVNAKVMAAAKPDAIFMHCLPAHRGQEVTDDVIDGPQSAVFDQAENRLHAQKSLLVHLIRGGEAFNELA